MTLQEMKLSPMQIQEMKQSATELGINNEDLAMYADVLPEEIDALFSDPPNIILNPSSLWFLTQILTPFIFDNSALSDSVVKESITPEIPTIYGFD